MIGNTYLNLKIKSLIKSLKDFQNSLMYFTLLSNIISNSTKCNLSNSLAQRYYALLDWAQETFAKAWSSLLKNSGKLMCNSTNFLRLTLSKYGKAFRLSTPVTY